MSQGAPAGGGTPRRYAPRVGALGLAASLALAACSSPSTTAGPAPVPVPAPTRGGHPTTSSVGPSSAGPGQAVGAPSAGTWATYQGDASRLGVAGTQPPLTPLRPAWTAALDGAVVHGQPLVAGGRVIVATEDDDVYALDPHNGSVAWQINLGSPLRNVMAATGCGNIDPLGVTSTPVVDATAGVVYAVGEVADAGRSVRHELAAISLGTGRVFEKVDVDPPLPAGENPLHLLQRAALALGNGRVYIGYGGQDGDCGDYHGWLVSIPAVTAAPITAAPTTTAPTTTAPTTTAPTAVTRTPAPAPGLTAFNVTPHGSGGAIWDSGAGPTIGSDGSVYVTTGNPNSTAPAPWSEAVLQMAPALGRTPEAAFQDRTASGDEDLATGDAVLLPGGDLFVVGKTDIGYVLRQADLAQLATIRGTVCGSDPDGGAAYDAARDSVYVPCRSGGIQQVDLRHDTVGWHSGSANSTPILVDGELWALTYTGGTLQEIDPASGRVLYSAPTGPVPIFAAPSAADGLLLVPLNRGVAAYSGPGGPPPEASY